MVTCQGDGEKLPPPRSKIIKALHVRVWPFSPCVHYVSDLMVLTVHVSFMLILNESIATRLPRLLVVHNIDLKQERIDPLDLEEFGSPKT